MSQLCKKISITLVVFENRVETNANMKINFHVWTFTEQVHKQRKKASSDFSLSWQKSTKSASCPQVKQFFSETSVLMCSETSVSHLVFGKRGPFLVTTSSTFEGSKKALLFCHNRIFRVYHICNETCPQKKKKMRRQLIVAFEKQTLKLQWKEDKIIRGKANSYFRRLSGRFAKMKKFPRLFIFSPLGWSSKWNWSKQFP